MMKDYIKCVAICLAGYFIGFYEYKYSVLKAIAEIKIDQLSAENEKESE